MHRMQAAPRELSTLAICLAGALSLAVAMGIGRFAFTPLLPLMARAGELDLAFGGWLAAANYAGYLAGALSAAKTLDVYFIDVEGGQATLYVTPSKQSMLVDAGWRGFSGRDADRAGIGGHGQVQRAAGQGRRHAGG